MAIADIIRRGYGGTISDVVTRGYAQAVAQLPAYGTAATVGYETTATTVTSGDGAEVSATGHVLSRTTVSGST